MTEPRTTDADKLHNAREWAKEIVGRIRDQQYVDTVVDAAEVILSLRGEIIDADKLRRIVFAKGDAEAKIGLIRAEFNLAPPRPTLEEWDDPEDCVGMWCEVPDRTRDGSCLGVIAWLNNNDTEVRATVTIPDRYQGAYVGESITPRPDLARAWNADGSPVAPLDPTDQQDLDDMDVDHPTRREDDDGMVARPNPKPGEAWLVEWEGEKVEALYYYCPIYANWIIPKREGYKTIESHEATPLARLVPDREVGA